MVNLEQELEQPQQSSSAPFVVSSVPAGDAAEVRVTPEELTQALSAVESRREQSSQHLASTIRLGEAVDQLGLGVTPEELLAEIVAQRSRAMHPPVVVVRKGLGEWQRRALIAALCLSVFPAAFVGLYFATHQPRTAAEIADAAQWSLTSASYPTLAEVSDGNYVKCDLVTLQLLAHGANYRQTRVVDLNEKDSAGLWSIVKRKGKVLVRCFAPQEQAVGIMNGKAGRVIPYESQAKYAGYMALEAPVSLFKDAARAKKVYSSSGGRLYDVLELPAR
jgi:hypothetical protein